MTTSFGPRASIFCRCENTEQFSASVVTNASIVPNTNATVSEDEVPLTEERLAILGHEIRNPLSALSYAFEALISSMDDSQRTGELLQIMCRQVLQLTRLSDDLLDTGRIARGQLSIGQAVVDVRKVIHDACEEVEPFANQNGHKMTVELDDFPSRVCGDESRLVQVLANLIQNSAKFNERNGNLIVSLARENNTAVIRVRDNGRGLSSEELSNLFRAPSASKKACVTEGAGLGIGLRLVKKVVELHGGTIDAFSDGLGHGSTFVVRLPMVADLTDENAISQFQPFASDQQGRKPLPHYRILVVDDDRSMRLLMSRILQKMDQSVTVADNGDMAIQMILRDRPQVVFLDLQMHGISGYDVASQLRSCIELNGLVLIALSGSADSLSRKRAAESGFDRYLVEPASVDMLVETLLDIDEPSVC